MPNLYNDSGERWANHRLHVLIHILSNRLKRLPTDLSKHKFTLRSSILDQPQCIQPRTSLTLRPHGHTQYIRTSPTDDTKRNREARLQNVFGMLVSIDEEEHACNGTIWRADFSAVGTSRLELMKKEKMLVN
jgi:hypothetical protein